MPENRRIAMAMSGGVDSSVAAALLVEQGEDVFGIMLRLWSSPDRTNRCCSPSDMAAARQIAANLDIPFYALDAQAPFKEAVVDFFLDGYAQGLTPNPCIECNRTIRWTFLLQQALAMGATHLATGHYARIRSHQKQWSLLRAEDPQKDQSYVLSMLGQNQLEHALFPLGNLTKPEVRQHGRRLGLAVADRSDSQDLCFVGNGNYRDFLDEHRIAAPQSGSIIDLDGTQIGVHQGLSAYTIGQRKGIGITRPYPLYVIQKDVSSNTLTVGPQSALGRSHFFVKRLNWVSGQPPVRPIKVLVRTRYKAREVIALVSPLSPDEAEVHLQNPIPDVTPGQSAVFYQNEICLGGGIIQP